MKKNLSSEVCTSTIIHHKTVKKVQKHMLEEDLIEDLADFFKLFGHSTRIKILQALLVSEMCVCDLSYTLDMTQSAISHQLRLLRDADLVKTRRAGRSIYYSLSDSHISSILNEGLDHVQE